MKTYLRQSFGAFIYLLLMIATAMAIFMIDVEMAWLRLVLALANFALYAFLVANIYFRNGQDGIKIRYVNDIERRRIIETGEDRPLKLHEEYKPWKGFFMGFIVCIPLLFFLLIHTILLLAGSELRTFGIIASVIYSPVFVIFRVAESQATMFTYYYTLFALPMIMAVTGIPYILGAKKMQKQYDMIGSQHDMIYGDKQ